MPENAKKRQRLPTVDTLWVKSKLDALGYTNRFAADKIGMDYPSFTRSINGERAWTIQNAVDFAALINVSLLELLPRVGAVMPAADLRGAGDQIPVTWQASTTSEVAPVKPAGKVYATAANAVEALRVQSVGSLDSAVLFLDVPKAAHLCVGRLCLVEVDGKHRLCTVRRGSDEGLYSLTDFGDPKSVRADVSLTQAQPATWAKL